MSEAELIAYLLEEVQLLHRNNSEIIKRNIFMSAQVNFTSATLIGISRTLQMPADSTLKDLPAWCEKVQAELVARRAEANQTKE